MFNITVIGTGYVGLVSGTCFADKGNKIICCDMDERKIDMLKNGAIPIYEPGLDHLVKKNTELGNLTFTTNITEAIKQSDILYVAVGTPMSESGEANLEYVKNVAATIGRNLNGYKTIVIKSTVPVGTARMVKEIIYANMSDKSILFDVASNPEFLREGNAIYDCMNMERAIIGVESEESARRLKELHAAFNTHIFITNLESAEMIKYASNAFLATKISFINGIANICEKTGADVSDVAVGMGLDSRIGKGFLQAGLGYGGSCFPKDTSALNYLANNVGYDFELLSSVININNRQRKIVIEKLINVLPDIRNKKIAILGLSFKPNTDDMRYAPSIDIINELHEMGARVVGYDPIATSEAQKILGDKLQYVDSPYKAVEEADACMILTEWQQITSMNLKQVLTTMRTPLIIDGRNCFALDKMEKLGFNYISIGRREVISLPHS